MANGWNLPAEKTKLSGESPNNMKLKILFIGTPEFGAIILEKLCDANLKPVLVITALDKPVGRKQVSTPPPVKIVAERYKVPVIQPKNILDSKFQTLDPGLIVVAAYGQILSKEVLEIPKFGCLNVHPSLLPKYRGASPIQFAILNGEKETGVTIILMDAMMDHGPILAQRKTIIGSNETAKQLHDRLALLGAELLIETVPDWLKEKIKVRSQDAEKATYTKILTKEDGKINWKKSAKEIERQIRAFNLWPETWTLWKKVTIKTEIKIRKEKTLRKRIKEIRFLKIKILRANVSKVANKIYPIGKTFLATPQKELCVQCKQGFLIVKKLQLEGKKPMDSEKFLRGHQDFIGTILK